MAGLDPQVIAALLSKSRTKGQYVERINEFLANGEAGISVSEQWPDMSGKNASTLKQGFDNAKDHKEAADGADQIKVVKSDEGVFLINLALVETAEAA